MVASMARRFVLSVAVVLAGCGDTLPPGVDCTFAAMESDYGTVPMTFRLDPDAVSASSNLHVDGDALVPDGEGEFTFTRASCPRVTGRGTATTRTLRLSEARLDFPVTALRQSSMRTLVIESLVDVDTKLVVDGVAQPFFLPTSAVLKRRERRVATVTFQPHTRGNAATTLTLTAEGAPREVPLWGYGGGPELVVDGGDFGNIAFFAGTTRPDGRVLQLTNATTGTDLLDTLTFDGRISSTCDAQLARPIAGVTLRAGESAAVTLAVAPTGGGIGSCVVTLHATPAPVAVPITWSAVVLPPCTIWPPLPPVTQLDGGVGVVELTNADTFYDCYLTWPRFDGDAGVVDVDWQTLLLPPLTTVSIPVRAAATDTFRVNVAHPTAHTTITEVRP